MYSIGVRGVIVRDKIAPYIKRQLNDKGIPVLELNSTGLEYVVLENSLVISSNVRKIIEKLKESLRKEVEDSKELLRILEEYRRHRVSQLE